MTLLPLWCWFAATIAHVVLITRLVRRFLPSASFDEQAFAVVLGSIGSLSCVLHVLATWPGLHLWTALPVLAACHLVTWRATSRVPIERASAGASPRAMDFADLLAAAVMVGLLLSWVDFASSSSSVGGTDAAHYHVPVAVNLALGARLFGLPATQHLYPMAASAMDAWFILPIGDSLLVDLTMSLPFLLLAVSVHWIFRAATGYSGLGWVFWLVLFLFSTPLFRVSSLVSADLWFAAAFAAVTAVLVSTAARGRWSAADVCLGSLALGLLVGSKATGAAAAALLVLVGLIGGAVQWVSRRTWPLRWPAMLRTVGVISALVVCSGGMWLVRNWLRAGSPIAPTGVTLFGLTVFSGDPFAPTTYLSVLGDLQKNPQYDLVGRALHFVRTWIGPWFVPAIALTTLVPVEMFVAHTRGRASATAARLMLWAITAGVGGTLVWLLIGAPWTSLEWTSGFSLRYALPVVALVPLVALTVLFPSFWPWAERTLAAYVAQSVMGVIALTTFFRALDPGRPNHIDVPPLNVTWMAAGAGIVWATVWLAARPRFARVAMIALPLVAASIWTPVVAARAAREHDRAERQDVHEREAFAQGTRPGSAGRVSYFDVLAAEEARGTRCAHRRFFLLSRFDEPLTLQPARYVNQVFYAGRDVEWTRSAGTIAPCDYIMSSQAVLDTEKGAVLVTGLAGGAELETLPTSGPWVIMTRRAAR